MTRAAITIIVSLILIATVADQQVLFDSCQLFGVRELSERVPV